MNGRTGDGCSSPVFFLALAENRAARAEKEDNKKAETLWAMRVI
jgi:hypothetical protein